MTRGFQLTKPGQIPSNLLLTRVSPRWVIPAVCTTLRAYSSMPIFERASEVQQEIAGASRTNEQMSNHQWLTRKQLELGWGIATLGSFAVKDVKSLYALRFLVGLFE